MRTALASALALAIIALAPAPAAARARGGVSHPFGLGLEVGAPTGLAAKYYFSPMVGLQMGLGEQMYWDDDGLHLHAEVVWHPVILTRQSAFTMPLYLGVGGFLLFHDHDWKVNDRYYDHDDAHLGVRAPIGILFDFNRVSLDVFIELALTFDLVHFDDDDDPYDHDHDLWFGPAFGVRYYF